MPSLRMSIGIVTVTAAALIAAACASDGDEPANTAGGAVTETASAGGHSMSDMDSDAPFDATFIDSMIEHHQGAITMAEQALVEAEHPELRTMAEEIIDAQLAEISQMESWRAEWYPGLAKTEGMDMAMGDMEVSADESVPFDQRFIKAMVAHHEGAVDMAEEALTQAEHEELRSLAQTIIDAQMAEIAQLEEWEAEWFGA